MPSFFYLEKRGLAGPASWVSLRYGVVSFAPEAMVLSHEGRGYSRPLKSPPEHRAIFERLQSHFPYLSCWHLVEYATLCRSLDRS